MSTKRLTKPQAKRAFVTVAEELGKLGETVIELRDRLEEDWPKEMYNSNMAPTLGYWLYSQADAFLADHAKLGIAELRRASEATEESVRIAWESFQAKALQRELETSVSALRFVLQQMTAVVEDYRTYFDGDEAELKRLRKAEKVLTALADRVRHKLGVLTAQAEDLEEEEGSEGEEAPGTKPGG